MSLACFEQTPAILGLTPFVRSATLSAQAISINHANRRTQRLQLKRQKNGNCIQELKQSSGKLHSVQWKLPPKHPQRKKTGCERRREGREREEMPHATKMKFQKALRGQYNDKCSSLLPCLPPPERLRHRDKCRSREENDQPCGGGAVPCCHTSTSEAIGSADAGLADTAQEPDGCWRLIGHCGPAVETLWLRPW